MLCPFAINYNRKERVKVAKGKYEKWLEPENLLLIEGWAKDGLTDEDIAANMGISRSTLNNWKNKYSDISDTLKKGKDVVDRQVENALLKEALDGNITAIIYWLNNRKPDKWRNKRTVEVEGTPDAAVKEMDDYFANKKRDIGFTVE